MGSLAMSEETLALSGKFGAELGSLTLSGKFGAEWMLGLQLGMWSGMLPALYSSEMQYVRLNEM